MVELKIHPAADVFPMLADDELNELAADIKANGLIHPIVVKDGVLIDGRNRLEACRRAGVEARTVELNGQDPAAFILSANINRRHMTKGQRAMAVAKIYPEAERKGGRGKTASTNAAETAGLSATRLLQARTVLQWATELADAVLAGAESLDKAYQIASDRKVQAEAPQKRLAALRATAPDLADRVVEENISVAEAEAIERQRRETERAQRQGLYDGLQEIERWMFIFRDGPNLEYLIATCRDHPNEIVADDVVANLQDWHGALGHALSRLTGGKNT